MSKKRVDPPIDSLKYVEQSKRLLSSENGKYCLIDEIMADIYLDIEYTREKHGFTKTQFAQMIDISRARYYKFAMDSERMLSLRSFLLFCGTFGVDIGKLLDKNYIKNENPAADELAIYLSRLSDETLLQIEEVIKKSSETSKMKETGEKLIEKVRNSPKKKPFFVTEVNPQIIDNTFSEYPEILNSTETRTHMVTAAVSDKKKAKNK